MEPVIKVENLSFAYPQATILKDLTFHVTHGEFLAVAGPNGAGKTTLLNLLCALLKPKTGSIHIDDAPLESYSTTKLAQKLAVVRQEFIPVFDFTVTEMVAMARTPYLPTFGFETKNDLKVIAEALEMTDTARFASRPLAQLSSGERQRVFIARALAQNTPILLLDEPTSFLDFKHQVVIYDLLKQMQLQKQKTILAITHDINLAAQYCNRILLLAAAPADTAYYIGKPQNVFSQQQIRKVFGVSTFAGRVGQEKFFLPLGKLAKDKNQIQADPQQ